MSALEIAREAQSKTNCFITISDDAPERRHREGALAGVPYAAKDNFCTRGIRTTCASRALENFIPPYSATVIERLEAAGAVLVGKANLDEFAMGSSGDTSYFGPTLNPRDPALSPGGSSSGSAAAVAIGAVPFALGSDTGGSVRQPAYFCGVYGFKPSYGAISRYGMVAFSSSLDTVGIIGKDVEIIQTVLDVLAAPDPHDATCVGLPSIPIKPHEALRVGVADGVLALSERAIHAYAVLSYAEAASNLARYDGLRYGHGNAFGWEVRRRIELGLAATERELEEARSVRDAVQRAFDEAFSQYDLLTMPVSPGGAPPAGVCPPFADQYTAPASLAGLPALACPDGTQIIGKRYHDRQVLAAALG